MLLKFIFKVNSPALFTLHLVLGEQHHQSPNQELFQGLRYLCTHSCSQGTGRNMTAEEVYSEKTL